MLENGLIGLLISWINGVLEGLTSGFANNTFYLQNPVMLSEMKTLYSTSSSISYTMAKLALLYCIIVFLMSFDLQELGRAKRKIGEILLLTLFLKTSQYFFDFVHGGLNAFTKTWSVVNVSGNGDMVGAVLSALGLSGALGSSLIASSLGLVIISLLGVVSIGILVLMVSHSLIISILKVLTILFPIILGASLADPVKPIFKKIVTLYISIGFIAPVQMLTLNICARTMIDNSGLSFTNAVNMIGMLIVVVILIPAVLLYLIVTASNMAKVD